MAVQVGKSPPSPHLIREKPGFPISRILGLFLITCEGEKMYYTYNFFQNHQEKNKVN